MYERLVINKKAQRYASFILGGYQIRCHAYYCAIVAGHGASHRGDLGRADQFYPRCPLNPLKGKSARSRLPKSAGGSTSFRSWEARKSNRNLELISPGDLGETILQSCRGSFVESSPPSPLTLPEPRSSDGQLNGQK